ncbi:hypothetical protein AAG906_021259 [Vitis piasezkii]
MAAPTNDELQIDTFIGKLVRNQSSTRPFVSEAHVSADPLALWSPGLGKTTLAHVVAKHCGYHVVEINASDDRSSSTIEAKILDVVRMNSVMVDSSPIVIDEIDGALGDGKGACGGYSKMVIDMVFIFRLLLFS